MRTRVVEADGIDLTTCRSGVDCLTFIIEFDQVVKDISEIKLCNKNKQEYGFISVTSGTGIVSINLAKSIRGDNIKSFGLTDVIALEMIKDVVLTELKNIIGYEVRTVLKSLEVNLTTNLIGDTKADNVLKLFHHSTLHAKQDKRDNLMYLGKNRFRTLDDEAHSLIVRFPGQMVLKVYDKSFEAKSKEPSERIRNNIPDDLIRVECVFLDRTLTRLFGTKLSIEEVLTKASLIVVLDEFKRIVCGKLIDIDMKKYLSACTIELTEQIQNAHDEAKKNKDKYYLNAAVANNKHLIPSVEILQKALKRFYKMRRVIDNSARDAKILSETYDISFDLFKTIKRVKELSS